MHDTAADEESIITNPQYVDTAQSGEEEHLALSPQSSVLSPLPRPTYWPVVLALAILFLAWGIVTTLAISAIGLVLFALALGGWIGELRNGHEGT